MLLSSCEGVSAAAEALARIPMSSGVGTCSKSASGLGLAYYLSLSIYLTVGQRQPSRYARTFRRASHRIVGSFAYS